MQRFMKLAALIYGMWIPPGIYVWNALHHPATEPRYRWIVQAWSISLAVSVICLWLFLFWLDCRELSLDLFRGAKLSPSRSPTT